MNTETGEVKYFDKEEEIKKPWVKLGKTPNGDCTRCYGKGSILKKSLHDGKQIWQQCSCTFVDPNMRPKS